MQISILRTDAEFDALEREWEVLLESSAQRVFFRRWHWNRTWWRVYAPPDSRLFLIICREPGGRLVGVGPCYQQTMRHFGAVPVREICFLGTGAGLRISEYLDLIAARGFEAEVARGVAACLEADSSWDRLALWGVPADSTVLPHFRGGFGGRLSQTVCDRAAVLDTSGSWSRTARHFSHDIDRAFRTLLTGPGARVELVQSLAEFESAFEDLKRLHALRWQAKHLGGSFARPGFETFLREVSRHAFEHGRLGLWRLWLDGQAVAALIAFADFGTVHYFQSGFDPSSPHSLGRVIIGLAIRDCVAADGIQTFDLMGGDGDYKREWTNAERETVELEMLRPTARAMAFGAARYVREHLARARRAYRMRRLSASRSARRAGLVFL